MATYSVQIQVNVPGVGNKTFTQAGIVAASPSEAIKVAEATVIVEVLALQKTA